MSTRYAAVINETREVSCIHVMEGHPPVNNIPDRVTMIKVGDGVQIGDILGEDGKAIPKKENFKPTAADIEQSKRARAKRKAKQEA